MVSLPVGGAVKITPHFDSAEFDQRAWSGGPRVEYPKDWIKDRLTPLCLALELIRTELGGKAISILSGYRSKAFNTSIGGARLSMHVAGRAADVRVSNVPAWKVHDVILRMSEQGLIPAVRGLGRYPSFVHVDVRPTVRLVRWDGESWTPGDT